MKNIIKTLLSKSGYKIGSTKYILKQFLQEDHVLKLNFDHVLSEYILNKPAAEPFSFIQIGAFDGIECDPLRKYLLKYNWQGVLMEPQPKPFGKLKKEYEGRPGLNVLNAAISKTSGQTALFILEGDDLPEWSKGMASFDKHNILKHDYLFPGIEKYIRKIEIETISFEEIFKMNSLQRLDLLQVDTEGFDAEIIFMFPFNKLKPSIIHFESKHIKKPNLEKLLDFLIENGYRFAYDGQEDMVAVLEKQTA